MKIAKNHNLFFVRSLALGFLLVLCALFISLGVSRSAYANPLPIFVADAATCTLPDGSGGAIANYSRTDNKTCCPWNSVNGQGQADSVSCFYGKYLNPLIALLAALVGVVVVIAIVFGAIEYITSNGDPQRTASGKKRIVNALLGLVAFLLLYAFLQFIVPGGLMHG